MLAINFNYLYEYEDEEGFFIVCTHSFIHPSVHLDSLPHLSCLDGLHTFHSNHTTCVQAHELDAKDLEYMRPISHSSNRIPGHRLIINVEQVRRKRSWRAHDGQR